MPKFANGTCITVGSTPINHLRLRYRNDGPACITLYNGWYVESRHRHIPGAIWQQFTTQPFENTDLAASFDEKSFGKEGQVSSETEPSTISV